MLTQLYEKISTIGLEEEDERATVSLETKCYLLHELGRPMEVIDNFLKISNNLIGGKVFEYLKANLKFQGKMENSPVFIGFAAKLSQLYFLNS